MRSLLNKLKTLFSKLGKYIKTNKEAFIGFLFYYIVPIGLISEYLAITKEIKGGTKLAIGGIVILIALLLVFRKKLKEKVLLLKKGYLRGILRILISGVFWAMVFGFIFVLKNMSVILEEYWLKVGICFIIGHFFYMWDEIKTRNKRIKEEVKE